MELPEQALDGIPLDLGLVVKINLLNFHVEVQEKSSTSYPCNTNNNIVFCQSLKNVTQFSTMWYTDLCHPSSQLTCNLRRLNIFPRYLFQCVYDGCGVCLLHINMMMIRPELSQLTERLSDKFCCEDAVCIIMSICFWAK